MSMLKMREYNNIEDIKRGFNLDDATALKLSDYVDILKKWTKKINLIGPDTLPDIWCRHIADSLQLSALIPDDAKTLIDFGSGAGLPGIILAICLPLEKVYLVESNGKKAAFLREASRKCGLNNVEIHHCRIEAVPYFEVDVITARALASFENLCPYMLPFFGQKTIALLPKGVKGDEELTGAQKNWKIKTTKQKSITNVEANIFTITRLEPR